MSEEQFSAKINKSHGHTGVIALALVATSPARTYEIDFRVVKSVEKKSMYLSVSKANHVRCQQGGNRRVSCHAACLFALVPFLTSKAQVTPKNMRHRGTHFLRMSVLAADDRWWLTAAIELYFVTT